MKLAGKHQLEVKKRLLRAAPGDGMGLKRTYPGAKWGDLDKIASNVDYAGHRIIKKSRTRNVKPSG